MIALSVAALIPLSLTAFVPLPAPLLPFLLLALQMRLSL